MRPGSGLFPRGGASEAPDPYAVQIARTAPALLREFNQAGMLIAADVHVATRLCELGGEHDAAVMLAAALAVRAPRLSHVLVDLATIRLTAAVETQAAVELSSLPWPEPSDWLARMACSAIVAVGEPLAGISAGERPLRLVGSRLYLDRYWSEEREVAAELLRRAAAPPEVDEAVLREGLRRLFSGEPTDSRQRLAGACAVLSRFSVIGGGPGTGKTTTVARVVALLLEQAAARGARPPLIALAAPTGKAAARLGEAVRSQAGVLDTDLAISRQLLGLQASTLHRLLGTRPGSSSRFRHDSRQHLPHDVVVVDEASMVSLSLMARLIEALRPGARLVVIGDPGQLASIEAGAVLGDIVGPAAERLVMSAEGRRRLERTVGAEPGPAGPPARVNVGDGIVVLDRVHRFGGEIAALAQAVRRGEADTVMALLRGEAPQVRWIAIDPVLDPSSPALELVRQTALRAGSAVAQAALAGEPREALRELERFRLLCAHRRGPAGVSQWTLRCEAWLVAELPGFSAEGRWYAGRPLLVRENDYELGLLNGDTGVIVQTAPGSVQAVFGRGGDPVAFSPSRLSAVDTLYAMTVHKSQGSQFDATAVLLPEPGSPILTRELLYTAVTRARESLILVGSEEAVRAAVGRPAARASGLQERLWGAA